MTDSHAWAVELEAFGASYASGWAGGKRWVLRDVNLRLPAGCIAGVFGPNGSGKTTLLKAMAGLVRRTAGVCRIYGAPAGGTAARAAVGYLPAHWRCSPRLTGRLALRFWAELEDGDAADRRRMVERSLEWVGLKDEADKAVAEYSQGMRQRLGLAVAVVHRPRVVLLDEPVNGLDADGRRMLARLLRELASGGATVVFSSHLLSHAEAICDRLLLVGRGRLLRDGTPRELCGTGWAPAAASPLEAAYQEVFDAQG